MSDRKRVRLIVAAGLATAGVAGAAGWALVGTGGGKAHPKQGGVVSTGTATVQRTDIAERQQVSGTLGHEGAYDIVGAGQGTITRLPAVGSTVKRGSGAYEVNGTSVPLFYGDRPAWRTFQLGMTNGSDVRQLKSNLVALGYGDGLTVDDHYSYATYWAVRTWQDAVHLPVTGTVPLGQIVFAPDQVRISGQDVKVGTPVHAGLLVEHGTSDHPAVLVQLDPKVVPNVKPGDSATISLPDGTTRQGTVSSVGAVTVPSSGSGTTATATATAPVTITIGGSVQGFLDQAPVQVGITSNEHKGVLALPIVALVAKPGGSYAVRVVNGASHQEVTVQAGLFDQTSGLVEVSGGGLTEGQQVEVPSAGS